MALEGTISSASGSYRGYIDNSWCHIGCHIQVLIVYIGVSDESVFLGCLVNDVVFTCCMVSAINKGKMGAIFFRKLKSSPFFGKRF